MSKKYRKFHGPATEIICCICGNRRLAHRLTQKTCSNKCAALFRTRNPDYKNKIREANLRLISEGRHKGWISRNTLSYPEKFFVKVLKNNEIKFITNKPVSGYFLDFAIDDKMIDLEIDGKQHQYPDRKISDEKRDIILSKLGWKIYRIKWNTINTENGKNLMKEKIEGFISFYKKISDGD